MSAKKLNLPNQVGRVKKNVGVGHLKQIVNGLQTDINKINNKINNINNIINQLETREEIHIEVNNIEEPNLDINDFLEKTTCFTDYEGYQDWCNEKGYKLVKEVFKNRTGFIMSRQQIDQVVREYYDN